MGRDDVRGVSKIAVIVATSRSTSDWTHTKASPSIIQASGGGLRGRTMPRNPPIGHETVADWALFSSRYNGGGTDPKEIRNPTNFFPPGR